MQQWRVLLPCISPGGRGATDDSRTYPHHGGGVKILGESLKTRVPSTFSPANAYHVGSPDLGIFPQYKH
jgi:hypothetical protein